MQQPSVRDNFQYFVWNGSPHRTTSSPMASFGPLITILRTITLCVQFLCLSFLLDWVPYGILSFVYPLLSNQFATHRRDKNSYMNIFFISIIYYDIFLIFIILSFLSFSCKHHVWRTIFIFRSTPNAYNCSK